MYYGNMSRIATSDQNTYVLFFSKNGRIPLSKATVHIVKIAIHFPKNINLSTETQIFNESYEINLFIT